MDNKDKKEMLKLKMSTMQRQFSYNQQGYSLIKCMVLRYALLSIQKDIASIREYNNDIVAYFSSLRDSVQDNIEKISSELGFQFRDLVLDCIVSFSSYNEKNSGFEQALYMIEELTQEDIKDFIVKGVENFGYRDNFGTPLSLCELVEKIFNVSKPSSIADYGCGNGDFLVNFAKNNPQSTYFGYEINYDSKLLTKIRLTFLGVKNDIFEGNVLHDYDKTKIDYIFSQPPFGMRVGSEFKYEQEMKHYSFPNIKMTQTAEWLFMDRILSSLSENGKGAIVVPDGLLTNQFDIDQRKYLVDNNYIEAIIKLPQGLFQTTNISTSLIVLSKNKSDTNCKFVDASEMFVEQGRIKNLSVYKIMALYNDKHQDISYESIKNNEYVLSVNRYKSLNDIKLENPVKLSELVEDIFRGTQIQADILKKYATNDIDKGVYKIVSSGDIVDGTFDINSLEKIKIQKNYDRYLLRDNDLLISCKSTKVKTAIVEIKDDEKIIPSGSIIVVRCKKDILSPIYLKMFLDSTVGKKLLASIQTGTTIISINPKALESINIACIPIDKQLELSTNYLSILDMLRLEKKKIEKLECKLATMYDDFMGD